MVPIKLTLLEEMELLTLYGYGDIRVIEILANEWCVEKYMYGGWRSVNFYVNDNPIEALIASFSDVLPAMQKAREILRNEGKLL